MFVPFSSPPGVSFPPTKASNSVYWHEAHLMRWESGKMQPVAGWGKLSLGATSSPIRACHQWVDNSGISWIAYLCDDNVYVEYDDALVSIAPTGGITAPDANFVLGGFGDNDYSFDDYGTARPSRLDKKSVGFAFTLDNWGEDLLIMSSVDGRLLRWSPSTLPPEPSEVVPNAPVSNRSFVVTPERYVVLFDYGGVRSRFAWCDQEDVENWNFADVTSKAGELPIEPRSRGVAAKRVSGGILHFSTTATYFIEHAGLPYVFNNDLISEGNAPLSDRSVAATTDGAVWMADNSFWAFNGNSVVKLECPVWNWVSSRIDWELARYFAASVHIVERSEVWFFFPERESLKNTHTVIYNYREGWWSMAKLGRSAGTSSSYTDYPIMADETDVYQHETGTSYVGAELPWIESYPLNTNRGGLFSTLKQIQPDFEGDEGNVVFSTKFKQARTPGVEETSPQVAIFDGLVDLMVTGKDIRVRVDSVGVYVAPWTLGDSLIDIVSRGEKV